jgi:hypothetical protein
MISLVVAAAVAAGEFQTLAGVTLGSNVRKVLSEHPDAKRAANGTSGWWRWSKPGGGVVRVSTDEAGSITRIDFQPTEGQDDTIDLPCVGDFPIQASHLNLESALNQTPCSAFNGATYGLPDHSLVAVRFNGPGDGQLIEATWYRPSDENPSPVGHMAAVIDYLRPTLAYVGGAARIDYVAECPLREQSSLVQDLFFPAVRLQRPLHGATGIDAIRQIFSDDPNVTVTQDRSGVVRIAVGSVSNAVLQTRIPSITLDSYAQYNAPSAIDAIAIASRIYAKEHGLSFDLGPYVIDHLVSEPRKGALHLPSPMQNITIGEALDAVARTFKGIATYGECAQPGGKRLFQPGFIYVS